nr:hypothetical protein [uncultured Rhodoferax sp.]
MDSALISILRSKLAAEIVRHDQELATRLRQIRHEMVASGGHSSTKTVVLTTEVYANGVGELGRKVWAVAKACMETAHLSYEDELPAKIKAVIYDGFPSGDHDLGEVNQAISKMSNAAMHEPMVKRYEEARALAVGELDAEIELFALNLKNRPAMHQGGIHIINSNIGAFQTGANSTANVTLTIETTHKRDLVDALDKLRQALTHDAQKGVVEAIEALGYVEDSVEEILKDSPKASKVKASLTMLGQAIVGTVSLAANAMPAYELTKVAAKTIGIDLP